MDLLAIPIFLCILWKIDFCRTSFHDDALSVAGTKAVRGILAVFIVLHHLYQQVSHGRLYFFFDNAGVLCVALFFFFSGYGLQKSHSAKPGYASRILTRRIPSVLVPYLLLTLLYWALSFLLGNPYSFRQVLGSLVNGNPIVSYSWYTECILLFYFLYYLSAILLRQNRTALVLFNTALSVLWCILCEKLGFAQHWYNMAIAFPAGIFWAAYEQALLPRLRKHYWLLLAGSLLCFGGCFVAALITTLVPVYWAAGCAFLLFMVLLLQKVAFRNRVLQFLGDLSFEIYSIQGLFFQLYRSDLIYLQSAAVWGAAVLVSSIPAAWVLHKCFRLLLSPGSSREKIKCK